MKMINTFIPIYIPKVTKNQKKYVIDCIESNMMSFRGKYVPEVEKKLSKYLTTKYFSLTFNGSVSLMTILSSLGIKHGDEVITQTLTYAATVFSILNVGATPVLVDSDNQYQMDLLQLEKAITKKTRAIIVAQLYGNSPDMVKLEKFCKDSSIYLIEDSAECFGCEFLNKKIGSFGIASSFSFFSNKLICSAGEGGGIATSDDNLIDRINFIKSQSHKGGFIHQGPFGYNHRATNIQAAVLLAQLEEIVPIIKRKLEIASFYRSNLTDKIERIVTNKNVSSTEWMPLFKLPHTLSYIKFHDRLKAYNIDARPCFTPVHLMDGFERCKKVGKLKVSACIYKSGFNLPCYPDLTNSQLEYIINSVNKIVNT